MADDERRYQGLRLLAHDLNNPLMAIRILAEMMEEDATDPAVRRDLADILEAVDLGIAIVGGFSASMRHATNDEPDYTWLPLDLKAQVVEVVAARPAFRAGVEVSLPDFLSASGDRRALQQALLDVLALCRRLAPKHRACTIHGEQLVSGACIRVVAPDANLPDDAIPLLLERWGAVELRSKRLPASALGLHYAAHVCAAHKGRLIVENHGSDLRVSMVLGDPG